ncbi:MAG: phenylacetate--CoA ligase family protein [bacterium]
MILRDIETYPREQLDEVKLNRFKWVIGWVYDRVPFYRQRFDKIGLKPHHIKTLKDIEHIPFTTKNDLRDNYPFGMFAVHMDDVVRIHASSGTTGKPTVVGYTHNDIETWAELMARALTSAGVHKGDILQNAYGYGLFTGGLGIHYGAEKLGAAVIPMSGGNTQKQVMLMQDFGTTVLTCTPSYALNIAEVAREMGINRASLKLKVGVFGAEPWTEDMRKEIEEKLQIDAIDIYGLSEIMGPGVAVECIEAKHGLHIYEDHFLPEIIDPEKLQPLPYGEQGELVITTLTKEAIPLIRYRTRDLTTLNEEPCTCGRTTMRMGRVTGRTDDMLIIRGVNVFPSQIESIILRIDGVEPYYQLIVDKEGPLDTLEVRVEVNDRIPFDEIKVLETMERKIEHDIKDYLGVSAKVKLVEPKSIERTAGKAVRVIDRRKK